METFEAVRTVLAVREYQDKSVPDDVLHRVIEAGRLSASARNQQEWHFVVVRDREGLRRLGSLVRTGRRRDYRTPKPPFDRVWMSFVKPMNASISRPLPVTNRPTSAPTIENGRASMIVNGWTKLANCA